MATPLPVEKRPRGRPKGEVVGPAVTVAAAASPTSGEKRPRDRPEEDEEEERPLLALTGQKTPRTKAKAKARAKEEEEENFAKMSEDERHQMRAKWWNYAGEATCPEDARFHVVLSALLHVKSREAAVTGAMKSLTTWAGDEGLTVRRLARADPEELVPHLQGVNWNSVKALRLVASAKVLLDRFGGDVPADKNALLHLPGIGPKLVGVLAFVLKEEQQPQRVGS